MKKLVLTGLISFLVSLSVPAQVGGPITIEKKGLKKSFVQDGKTLDAKQLGMVLTSDKVSSKHYKTARATGFAALAAIGCGTVSAGFGLYNSIKAAQATNDGDLAASTDYSNKSSADLLITAGCFAVSLPLLIVSNKQMSKSINLYNSSRKTGSLNRIDLNIGFIGNGAMVRLRFLNSF